MKRIACLWSLAFGAMDALTGLLLVISPALVIRLLAIPEPGPLEFLSWVGVFVGSVGLSYGLVLRGTAAAETVWSFTALVRFAVAGFLTVKILRGTMPVQWLSVAATDAIVATVQCIGLRKGWWRDPAD